MCNEKASPSENEEIEPVPESPLMSDKLQRAAIEGRKNDLIRLLRLKGVECNPEHEVKVQLQENAPEQFGTTEENIDDIQSATYMGNTVLHLLATYGHSHLLSMCYANKQALLRKQNKKLETPLHCAAKAGHEDAISKLIDLAHSEGEVQLKEFLRAKNHNEETALHEAARHGHARVASVLMDEDPDLAGVVNNENISPLYMATARGSIDVVQTMVEKMSDRVVVREFFVGPNGQTALHAAVLRDAAQDLYRAWKKTRQLIRTSTDKTPVCHSSFTALVLQLRSGKPLAKEVDDAGSTPLHVAASVGCDELVELLLEGDTSSGYLRNSDGMFPVHVAACNGHVKTIIVLLQRCIGYTELLDNCGKNFFHIAAEENRFEVFLELLKKPRVNVGISCRDEIFRNMINTGDSEGNTPLHLAVHKGNATVVRALLENEGLDLSLQNKKGLTACDLFAIEGQKGSSSFEVMRFLIEYHYEKKGILFSPAWFKHSIDNQIVRTEPKKVKQHPIDLKDRIQIIGLGSVLIATVAFAAAFTLPGGNNQNNGIPVLGRSYYFKAFILADVLAFALSFFCTAVLMFYCTADFIDQHHIDAVVKSTVGVFTVAAKCLALALSLGLYVVLSPVSKGICYVVALIGIFLSSLDPISLRTANVPVISVPDDRSTPRFQSFYNFYSRIFSTAKYLDALIVKRVISDFLFMYGRVAIPFVVVFLFALL